MTGQTGASPAQARGRFAVLQHVAFEGPGLIAAAAADAGIALETIRLDEGAALPAADAFDGLVVMGGPMGAVDDDEHPWLADERDLLAATVHAGRPVLGVCLGAQLLAAALGAPVTRGERSEVGPGTVTLGPAGASDPVLGPAGSTIPVLHWHRDTFGIPDGGELLASSEAFAHQAFRVGDLAYGFQFHVEVDSDVAVEIRPYLPRRVELTDQDADRIGATGRPILDRFFARAASADAGGVGGQ